MQRNAGDFGMNGQQPLHETDTHTEPPAPGQAENAAPASSIDAQLAAQGARFAQAREAKGWSLGDVSSRMKVPVNKLRALEAGDISSLPDTTAFAVGMMRSYAKSLDIDATPFISLLRQVRGETSFSLSMPASSLADLPGNGQTLPSFEQSTKKHRGSWMLYTGAVIIAVIALGLLRANQHGALRLLSQLQAVSASKTGGADQSGGASLASVTEHPASPGSASSAQGSAHAAPVSSVTAASTASVDVPASETQQAETLASATPSPDMAEADAATIVVRTTQDTWISVRQKDGKEVFSHLVHGNNTQQVSGVAPLKVTLGNIQGIGSITLNGQPVDVSKYTAPDGSDVAHFTLP